MFDIVILTENRYVNPATTNWYIDQVLLEDQLLQTALEDKGSKVCKRDWADRNFDLIKTKYAIFRTTWDYFDRFDEFLSWLDQTKHKTTFINCQNYDLEIIQRMANLLDEEIFNLISSRQYQAPQLQQAMI